MKLKTLIKWTGLRSSLRYCWRFWWVHPYWLSTNECFRNASAPTNPMKAIVHCESGSPDVLELKDVQKPIPNDNQVLVKVRAVAVNPLDLTISGPLALRPISGLRKPKETRVGVDYSGTVEAVGKNVTNLKTGDEVFGGKTGAFAESRLRFGGPRGRAQAQQRHIRRSGCGSSRGHHRVAGSPRQRSHSGRSKGLGERGVRRRWHFRGANRESVRRGMTGVCSTRNVDLVRSIGADHVIDYTKEDFTNGTEKRFDLIFRLVC